MTGIDHLDRHAAFIAGLELGMAYRCHLDTTEADHEAAHAAVRPMVLAMVADLNARGIGDHQALQQRRRQHQLDAWQANLAAARPWPVETAPADLGPWPPFGSVPFQRRAS